MTYVMAIKRKLMRPNTIDRFIRSFYYILFILLVAALAYSVIVSGLRYQYDADELTQLQQGYLMATGAKPYQDFYFVYTPIFPAIVGFVLGHLGFTFATAEILRIGMIVLFGIRILLTSVIVAQLFGSLAAWIFPLLLLLDPFTTFVGMQIRYDNFMLTVFTLGITLCIAGVKRKNSILMMLAGASLALSFLIIAKIVLSLAIFLFLFSVWCIVGKRARVLLAMYLGGLITLCFYSIPFVLGGSFMAMIQQAFIAPSAFHGSIINPTYVGFLYQPDNAFMYGLPGRPLPWVYAWGLPILGFAGAHSVVVSRIGRKGWGMHDVVAVSFAGALGAHWIVLFTLPLVFVQYYLPISTYFALFGAVTIAGFYHSLGSRRRLRMVFCIAWVAIVVIFVRSSYQANMARAAMDTHWVVERYKTLWDIIPPHEAVFPEVLFRPIAYPLFSGHFTCCRGGEVLFARYGPVHAALAAKNVNFLVLSDYALNFLPPKTRSYIANSYTKSARFPDLYVRNQ